MMITISFEAENDSFVEDFDGEIKSILKQAEDFLTDKSNNDILHDANGNSVGHIYRSTIIKPRRKINGR